MRVFMLTDFVEETLAPKLRGGYYTPPAIARFLAEWVVQCPTDTVLEPSCGDGELVTAAARRLLHLGATPCAVGYLASFSTSLMKACICASF